MLDVPPKVIHVALVEDDEEIRANLTVRISRSPSFRLLGSYSDAETALVELPKQKPDVVLMDINLPGMDGVECVRRIKTEMPEVHVIMLTVYEDGNRLFNSLIAGASGYLLKRSPADKLLTAIQEVYEGGAPMTPEIARRLVQHFRQISEPQSGLPKLTPRERDILKQLAQGYRYKEIVDNLGVSIGTLHSYISRIYEKLQVHSRTEAVLKYLKK